MSLSDLEAVKKELEEITQIYRKTFGAERRLELIERVKKLMALIAEFI